jgi:hypothetical protein
MSYFYMLFKITQVRAAVSASKTFIGFLSSVFSDMGSHVINTMCMVVTLVTTNKIERNVWTKHMFT